jgi:hypothetical protein
MKGCNITSFARYLTYAAIVFFCNTVVAHSETYICKFPKKSITEFQNVKYLELDIKSRRSRIGDESNWLDSQAFSKSESTYIGMKHYWAQRVDWEPKWGVAGGSGTVQFTALIKPNNEIVVSGAMGPYSKLYTKNCKVR